jgi:hypothetical protein
MYAEVFFHVQTTGKLFVSWRVKQHPHLVLAWKCSPFFERLKGSFKRFAG